MRLTTWLSQGCFVLLSFGVLVPLTGWGQLPTTTAMPGIGVPVHVTDEQDRVMSGRLSPEADDQSHANALYASALLLLNDLSGDRNVALEELRQVVALDPHCVEAQIKVADLLLQSGQTEPAFEQLSAATKANPRSLAIKSALGYTQKLRGQTDEALRLCTEALKEDSGQSMAMRVLLEIPADQNDLAGGVLHVEDILEAGGLNVPASAWIALARLYTEIARGGARSPTGDTLLKTLLPIYQQAVAKAPPDVETLTLLADTCKDLGRKREALKALRQAAALEPFNVDIILRCADLENDLGHSSEALKDYEAAYAVNQNLPGLREMLGRLYLESKRYSDAVLLLQEALADAPDDPSLGVNLGIAYEKTNQPEKAQGCFQRVFASAACPPDAYLKLAFFQLTNSQVNQAGKTLADAVARFPKSAKIRFYQAVQYRYAKNYASALASLNEARALANGPEAGVLDANFYLESVLTQNLAGKNNLVPATLNEGLVQYPDNTDLMNELAYFWADHGTHLPEALLLSQHAAELAPDNGAIEDTCGWVCFAMGRTKDALPYLQRAAVLTNNDTVVLQHLGEVYLKLGRAGDAIATWRRALKNDPGNRDLAGRIDAALAQANDAHLRYAPIK